MPWNHEARSPEFLDAVQADLKSYAEACATKREARAAEVWWKCLTNFGISSSCAS